jgi:hypothetical protein
MRVMTIESDMFMFNSSLILLLYICVIFFISLIIVFFIQFDA